MINVDLPVFPQIYSLDWKEYEKVLDKPLMKQDCVLFSNSLVEQFSKTAWWMIVLVWWPVIAMLVYSNSNFDFTSLLFWLHFVGGLVTWMFLEYLLHRHLFHSRYIPPIAHFFLHGQHHILPKDNRRLLFPPIAASVIAYPIFLLVNLLSPSQPLLVMAGILTGYTFYDLTHYYIHHTGSKPLGPFAFLQKNHKHHHYVNDESNYGISSPFIDILFGTFNTPFSPPFVTATTTTMTM